MYTLIFYFYVLGKSRIKKYVGTLLSIGTRFMLYFNEAGLQKALPSPREKCNLIPSFIVDR